MEITPSEEDSLSIRIMSGIDDCYFSKCNKAFSWIFDNFEIEEEFSNIKNVYDTVYYITFNSFEEFATFIEKVNFEITEIEFYIDDETSYIQKAIVINGIDIDEPTLFNDIWNRIKE